MKKFLLFITIALSLVALSQNQYSGSHFKQSSIKLPNHHQTWQVGNERNASTIIDCNKVGIHSTLNVLSGSSLLQIMDSIYHWEWNTDIETWLIEYKTTDMVYDSNNNLVDQKVLDWYAGEWWLNKRIISTFDDNNNLVKNLYKSWNGLNWSNDMQSIYTYDGNNNQTSYSFQYWYGENWVSSRKFMYTYDANNNLILSVYQTRNDSVLENNLLQAYSYDANNNQTSELYQNWEDSSWVNFRKNSRTFDANNNLLDLSNYLWTASVWLLQGRATFSYGINNLLVSQLSQAWSDGAWENSSLIDFTYNDNNKLLNELHRSWQDTAWEDSFLYTYTYDDQDNLTKKLCQHIHGNGDWINFYQSANTYDANGFWESFSNKSWSWDGSVVESGDSSSYYFQTIVGQNDLLLPDATFTVYPNPNNGKFTISSKQAIHAIEIYNLLGEQIYSIENWNSQSNWKIDLPGQVSGVFVLKIYHHTGISTRKIIVH